MGEAAPGRRGKGASLGSVLCSSRVIDCGRSLEEYFQILAEQVASLECLDHWALSYIICGDFNARCVDLDTNSAGLPVWSIINVEKNSQGEAFVEFLRGANMTVVNGRKGRDAFTCVSGIGAAVWWITA